MIIYYALKAYEKSRDWLKENILTVIGIMVGQFLFYLL